MGHPGTHKAPTILQEAEPATPDPATPELDNSPPQTRPPLAQVTNRHLDANSHVSKSAIPCSMRQSTASFYSASSTPGSLTPLGARLRSSSKGRQSLQSSPSGLWASTPQPSLLASLSNISFGSVERNATQVLLSLAEDGANSESQPGPDSIAHSWESTGAAAKQRIRELEEQLQQQDKHFDDAVDQVVQLERAMMDQEREQLQLQLANQAQQISSLQAQLERQPKNESSAHGQTHSSQLAAQQAQQDFAARQHAMQVEELQQEVDTLRQQNVHLLNMLSSSPLPAFALDPGSQAPHHSSIADSATPPPLASPRRGPAHSDALANGPDAASANAEGAGGSVEPLRACIAVLERERDDARREAADLQDRLDVMSFDLQEAHQTAANFMNEIAALEEELQVAKVLADDQMAASQAARKEAASVRADAEAQIEKLRHESWAMEARAASMQEQAGNDRLDSLISQARHMVDESCQCELLQPLQESLPLAEATADTSPFTLRRISMPNLGLSDNENSFCEGGNSGEPNTEGSRKRIRLSQGDWSELISPSLPDLHSPAPALQGCESPTMPTFRLNLPDAAQSAQNSLHGPSPLRRSSLAAGMLPRRSAAGSGMEPGADLDISGPEGDDSASDSTIDSSFAFDGPIPEDDAAPAASMRTKQQHELRASRLAQLRSSGFSLLRASMSSAGTLVSERSMNHAAVVSKALSRVLHLQRERESLVQKVQALSGEHSDLAGKQRSLLSRLDEVLQENGQLRDSLAAQMRDLGALDQVQSTLQHEVDQNRRLHELEGEGLRSEITQLQMQVASSAPEPGRQLAATEAMKVLHHKLKKERGAAMRLQEDKMALQERLLALQPRAEAGAEAAAQLQQVRKDLQQERARIEQLLQDRASLATKVEHLQLGELPHVSLAQEAKEDLQAERLRIEALLQERAHLQGRMEEVAATVAASRDAAQQLEMVSKSLQAEQERSARLERQLQEAEASLAARSKEVQGLADIAHTATMDVLAVREALLQAQQQAEHLLADKLALQAQVAEPSRPAAQAGDAATTEQLQVDLQTAQASMEQLRAQNQVLKAHVCDLQLAQHAQRAVMPALASEATSGRTKAEQAAQAGHNPPPPLQATPFGWPMQRSLQPTPVPFKGPGSASAHSHISATPMPQAASNPTASTSAKQADAHRLQTSQPASAATRCSSASQQLTPLLQLTPASAIGSGRHRQQLLGIAVPTGRRSPLDPTAWLTGGAATPASVSSWAASLPITPAQQASPLSAIIGQAERIVQEATQSPGQALAVDLQQLQGWLEEALHHADALQSENDALRTQVQVLCQEMQLQQTCNPLFRASQSSASSASSPPGSPLSHPPVLTAAAHSSAKPTHEQDLQLHCQANTVTARADLGSTSGLKTPASPLAALFGGQPITPLTMPSLDDLPATPQMIMAASQLGQPAVHVPSTATLATPATGPQISLAGPDYCQQQQGGGLSEGTSQGTPGEQQQQPAQLHQQMLQLSVKARDLKVAQLLSPLSMRGLEAIQHRVNAPLLAAQAPGHAAADSPLLRNASPAATQSGGSAETPSFAFRIGSWGREATSQSSPAAMGAATSATACQPTAGAMAVSAGALPAQLSSAAAELQACQTAADALAGPTGAARVQQPAAAGEFEALLGHLQELQDVNALQQAQIQELEAECDQLQASQQQAASQADRQAMDLSRQLTAARHVHGAVHTVNQPVVDSTIHMILAATEQARDTTATSERPAHAPVAADATSSSTAADVAGEAAAHHIARLQEQVDSLRAECASLRQAQGLLETTQVLQAQQEREADAAQQRIADLEQQLGGLHAESQRQRADVQAAQQRVADVTQQLEAAQAERQGAHANATAADQAAIDKQTQVAALARQCRELTAQVDSSAHALEQREALYCELQAQHDATQQAQQAAQEAALDAAQQLNAAQAEKLALLTQQLLASKAEHQALQTAKSECVAELQTTVRNLQQAVAAEESECQRLKDSAASQKLQMQQEVDSLAQQLAVSRLELQALQVSTTDATTALQLHIHKLEQHLVEVTSARSTTASTSAAKARQLELENTALQQRVQQLDAQLTWMRASEPAQAAASAAQVTDLQQRLAAAEVEAQACQTTAAQEISCLQWQVDTLERQLAACKLEYDTCAKAASEQQADLQRRLTASEQERQAADTAHAAEEASLKLQLEDLERRLVSSELEGEASRTAFSTQKDRTDLQLHQLNQRLASSRLECDALRRALNMLEEVKQDSQAKQARIADFEGERRSLETRIARVQAECMQIQGARMQSSDVKQRQLRQLLEETRGLEERLAAMEAERQQLSVAQQADRVKQQQMAEACAALKDLLRIHVQRGAAERERSEGLQRDVDSLQAQLGSMQATGRQQTERILELETNFRFVQHQLQQENVDKQQQLDQATSKSSELLVRYQACLDQVSTLKDVNLDKQQQLEAVQDKHRRAQRQLEDYSVRLEALQQEKEAQQCQLAEHGKGSMDLQQKYDACLVKISHLEQSAAALQQQLADMQSALQAEHAERAQQLQAERAEQAQRALAEPAQVAELGQQVSLQQQLAELECLHEQQTQQLAAKEQACQELTCSLQQTGDTARDLEAQLSRVQQAEPDAIGMSAAHAREQELTMALADLRAKMAVLEREHTSLQDQLAAADTHSGQVHAELGALQALSTGQHRQLQSLSGEVADAHAKLAAADVDLSTERAEHTASQGQLEALTTEALRMHEQLKAARAETEQLSQRLQTSTAEHDTLAGQHAAVTAERDGMAASLQAALAEQTSLQDRLQSSQVQCGEAEQALQTAVTDRDVLTERLSASSLEHGSLEERLAACLAKNSDLQLQLRTAVSDREVLAKQLSALSLERGSWQERLAASQAQCAGVEANLCTALAERDALMQQLGAAQSEHGNVVEQLAALQIQCAEQAEDLHAAVAARDALQSDLQSSAVKHDALASELRAVAAERDALAGDLPTVAAERDALASELRTVAGERDALAGDLRASAVERDVLFQEAQRALEMAVLLAAVSDQLEAQCQMVDRLALGNQGSSPDVPVSTSQAGTQAAAPEQSCPDMSDAACSPMPGAAVSEQQTGTRDPDLYGKDAPALSPSPHHSPEPEPPAADRTSTLSTPVQRRCSTHTPSRLGPSHNALAHKLLRQHTGLVAVPEAESQAAAQLAIAASADAPQAAQLAGSQPGAACDPAEKGILAQLRAQLGRLSEPGSPATPKTLAAERRTTFLQVIEKLEGMKAENGQLWHLLEGHLAAGNQLSQRAQHDGQYVATLEAERSALAQRLEAVMQERADVGSRLATAQVAVKHLQRAVTRLGSENATLISRLEKPPMPASAVGLRLSGEGGMLTRGAHAARAAPLAQRVERLQLEKKLLKAICKLAIAVATDHVAGGREATRIAADVDELMGSHAEAVQLMGLEPAWLSLRRLAAQLPATAVARSQLAGTAAPSPASAPAQQAQRALDAVVRSVEAAAEERSGQHHGDSHHTSNSAVADAAEPSHQSSEQAQALVAAHAARGKRYKARCRQLEVDLQQLQRALDSELAASRQLRERHSMDLQAVQARLAGLAAEVQGVLGPTAADAAQQNMTWQSELTRERLHLQLQISLVCRLVQELAAKYRGLAAAGRSPAHIQPALHNKHPSMLASTPGLSLARHLRWSDDTLLHTPLGPHCKHLNQAQHGASEQWWGFQSKEGAAQSGSGQAWSAAKAPDAGADPKVQEAKRKAADIAVRLDAVLAARASVSQRSSQHSMHSIYSRHDSSLSSSVESLPSAVLQVGRITSVATQRVATQRQPASIGYVSEPQARLGTLAGKAAFSMGSAAANSKQVGGVSGPHLKPRRARTASHSAHVMPSSVASPSRSRPAAGSAAVASTGKGSQRTKRASLH